MTHAATIADDRLEAALALPGARRSLRVAIGHLNVSLPDSVSEQELLGSLLDIRPFSTDRVCVREFLNEAELETLSDLVASGAISYGQLADAASLHLPSGHETRRWLDDRKGL